MYQESMHDPNAGILFQQVEMALHPILMVLSQLSHWIDFFWIAYYCAGTQNATNLPFFKTIPKSHVKSPSCDNQSTGVEIRHVLNVSKADLPSSSGLGSRLRYPFLSMDVKGAAILAKWSTKRRYTLHIPRNERSSVWVRGGFASANAETFFGWT